LLRGKSTRIPRECKRWGIDRKTEKPKKGIILSVTAVSDPGRITVFLWLRFFQSQPCVIPL